MKIICFKNGFQICIYESYKNTLKWIERNKNQKKMRYNLKWTLNIISYMWNDIQRERDLSQTHVTQAHNHCNNGDMNATNSLLLWYDAWFLLFCVLLLLYSECYSALVASSFHFFSLFWPLNNGRVANAAAAILYRHFTHVSYHIVVLLIRLLFHFESNPFASVCLVSGSKKIQNSSTCISNIQMHSNSLENRE